MVPFSLPPELPSRSCPGEALPGLPAKAAQQPPAPPASHLPSFAVADGQEEPRGLKAAPAQAAVRINWMGTSSLLLSRTWETANCTTPNPAPRPKTKATGPSHSPARQPHVAVKQHTELPHQPRNPRQPCLASQGWTPMWACAPPHLRSAHHNTQSCSLLSWQEAQQLWRRKGAQEASRPDPHLL